MKKIFLDLGMQPLANDFRKRYVPPSYKLKVSFDTKTKLVMINKHLKKEEMFNKAYPYRSSKSKSVKKIFKQLSISIKKRFKPKKILEIGSNDGTFALNFKKENIVCIEPCKEVALEARKKGLKVHIDYFDNRLVKTLKKKYQNFDLIFSANTITHISDYNSIFSNLSKILSDDGVLIIEEPSLLEAIKNNTYDQFYNEHIYVFSSISLNNILKKNNLEIYDVENLEIHGGSNRYYIKKKNKIFKISKRLKDNLKKEFKFGLNELSTHIKFSKKVYESKKKLVKIFNDLKKQNKKIIGYGASAKAVTIVNYCNLKEDYFDYFYDTTKQKINKFLPGTKIKVIKYKKLKNVKKYVFLGAWNFYKEILKKEDYFFNRSGKFITHAPNPRIIKKKI
jgi:methylation protein EvaC